MFFTEATDRNDPSDDQRDVFLNDMVQGKAFYPLGNPDDLFIETPSAWFWVVLRDGLYDVARIGRQWNSHDRFWMNQSSLEAMIQRIRKEAQEGATAC